MSHRNRIILDGNICTPIQRQLDDVSGEFDGVRDYYICSVPQMVVTTKEYLAELGVPEENIHSDGWEGGAVSN